MVERTRTDGWTPGMPLGRCFVVFGAETPETEREKDPGGGRLRLNRLLGGSWCRFSF